MGIPYLYVGLFAISTWPFGQERVVVGYVQLHPTHVLGSHLYDYEFVVKRVGNLRKYPTLDLAVRDKVSHFNYNHQFINRVAMTRKKPTAAMMITLVQGIMLCQPFLQTRYRT